MPVEPPAAAADKALASHVGESPTNKPCAPLGSCGFLFSVSVSGELQTSFGVIDDGGILTTATERKEERRVVKTRRIIHGSVVAGATGVCSGLHRGTKRTLRHCRRRKCLPLKRETSLLLTAERRPRRRGGFVRRFRRTARHLLRAGSCGSRVLVTRSR